MPVAPGSVSNVQSSASVGALSNTTAQTLTVSVPGIADLGATVRITEPSVTPATRAAVFITGGFGIDWWEDVEEVGQPAGSNTGLTGLQYLQTLGIKLVQVKWDSPGWWSSGVSWKAQSGRGATIFEWIRRTHCPSGRFALVGNSGGASLIAYGLTTWGLGSWVDVAVLCGGPVHIRLDLACEDPPDSAWVSLINGLCPSGTFPCGQQLYVLQAGSAACLIIPAWTDAQLRADSIDHLEAEFYYSSTAVHFVIGGQDCASAGSLAFYFHSLIRSAKRIWIPWSSPHWVSEVALGRDTIAAAINFPRAGVTT